MRLDGGCSWLGARPVNREGVVGCRGLQGGDRGRADLACCGCCLQRPAGEVGLPCPAAMGSGLLRQQERRKHGGVLVDLLPRRWAAIRGCGLGCRGLVWICWRGRVQVLPKVGKEVLRPWVQGDRPGKDGAASWGVGGCVGRRRWRLDLILGFWFRFRKR